MCVCVCVWKQSRKFVTIIMIIMMMFTHPCVHKAFVCMLVWFKQFYNRESERDRQRDAEHIELLELYTYKLGQYICGRASTCL